MRLRCIQGDITRVNVDAIVNAANEGLGGGDGVDGAIHRAGGPAILEACQKIAGGCPTGDAVITTAGLLPAQKVIHTVGPVWKGGAAGEAEFLASCYTRSMALAEEHDLRTLAFPNISTGVYGYPREKAARVAISSVRKYQARKLEEVLFVCYDAENFRIYQALLDKT